MFPESIAHKKIITAVILAGILTTGFFVQSRAVPISASDAVGKGGAPVREVFILPEAFQKADWDLLCKINQLPASPAAYALGWITHLGTKLYLLMLIGVLMVVWDPEHFARRFSFVFISLVAQEGAVSLLKHLLARSRPFVQAAQGVGSCSLNVFFAPPDSFSMPSGHSAAAFAAAGLICGLYGKRFAPLYFLAMLISLSRAFVGVHFPSDILAGATMGLLWAWGSLRAGRMAFR